MQQSHPYVISGADAEGSALTPLRVDERAFSEEWLQELLYKHPSILPVESLGEAFAPLIPIGREIDGIDNLFISPSGNLSIVETKLWRNPEAHRTVVAQILDYAQKLATWNYEQLSQAVERFTQNREGRAQSLYRVVTGRRRNLDVGEVEFRSLVQESLESGRFALIIVGDRIMPGATQLAETIQAAPHLQYTFRFVELQCYRLAKDSEWPLLVVPRLVTKTKEVPRAIVKVFFEHKKPEIEITAPTGEKPEPGKVSFAEFVASLPSTARDVFKPYLEGWIRDGYTVSWGTLGFSLRIKWKGKTKTLIDAYPTAVAILKEQRVREEGFPDGPYQVYRSELVKSPNLGSALALGGKYVKYLTFSDLSRDDLELVLRSTDQLLRSIKPDPRADS